MAYTLPGLAKDQIATLNVHSERAFGVLVTDNVRDFNRFGEGMVIPITVRHYTGYTPPNAQIQDVMVSLGGGYTQECVVHTLAFIDRRVSNDEVVVKLPGQYFFSHKSGAVIATDTYSLYRADGAMAGHYPHGKEDWVSHKPTWSVTAFPVLPVVCSGLV